MPNRIYRAPNVFAVMKLIEKRGNLDPRGLTPALQDQIIGAIGQDRFRTYLAELYPQSTVQVNHDALAQIGLGVAPGVPSEPTLAGTPPMPAPNASPPTAPPTP